MMQLTEARWSPDGEADGADHGGLPARLLRALRLVLFFGRRALLSVGRRRPSRSRRPWLNVPFMSLRTGLGRPAPLLGGARLLARAVFAEGTAGDESAGAGPPQPARRHPPDALRGRAVALGLRPRDVARPDLVQRPLRRLLRGHVAVHGVRPGDLPRPSAPMRAGSPACRPSAIQDVAKLTFAMCVMWMYFFFSQYLVIWYGNVPVETALLPAAVLRRARGGRWPSSSSSSGALIPFAYLLKRLTGRPPTRHKRVRRHPVHGLDRHLLRADHARLPVDVEEQCAADRSGRDSSSPPASSRSSS